MLKQFETSKQMEIQLLKEAEKSGNLPEARKKNKGFFKKALLSKKPVAVIAEYKRASPSRGIIREELSIEAVAKMYINAGCAALSILTEEEFFKGSLEFIDRASQINDQIPILRKDFIYDPVQIKATAATSANAMLLIARAINNEKRLYELRKLIESFGMDCVVEVFDNTDLEMARKTGAQIIQVNSRDLDTLTVNLKRAIKLIKDFPPLSNEIWIAASGITTVQDLRKIRDAGYQAALIGSALMEKPDPGKALEELIAGIMT